MAHLHAGRRLKLREALSRSMPDLDHRRAAAVFEV
jgi:hypothetical protein